MNQHPFRTNRLWASLLAAGLVAVPAAYAHHGFGNFAMDEDIELSGIITKIDFVNPHSWVHFEVTQPDGTKAQYRCELRSATTLRRSGWTTDMFAAGTQITCPIDDPAHHLVGHLAPVATLGALGALAGARLFAAGSSTRAAES